MSRINTAYTAGTEVPRELVDQKYPILHPHTSRSHKTQIGQFIDNCKHDCHKFGQTESLYAEENCTHANWLFITINTKTGLGIQKYFQLPTTQRQKYESQTRERYDKNTTENYAASNMFRLFTSKYDTWLQS